MELEYHELLSTFAYNFNVRRYSTAGVDVTLVHDVRTDGSVAVCASATAAASLPPVPRAGLRMRCPEDMAAVEWWDLADVARHVIQRALNPRLLN